MRLVVTGANGQVGCELGRSLTALGTVIALDCSQCDLSRPELLPDVVRSLKPDVIVNAAAYTAVDDAEREEDLATVVKGTAADVLAREAARAGALLVHYSTDYVFDGCKDVPYAEDDLACPVNAYGRSNLAGEAAVAQADGEWLILRTSGVYGLRGRNFLRTMLALLRESLPTRLGADLGGGDRAGDRGRGCSARTRGEPVCAGAVPPDGGGSDELIRVRGGHREAGDAGGMLAGARAARLVPIASKEFARPAVRPKNSRLAGGRMQGGSGSRCRGGRRGWSCAWRRCGRAWGREGRLAIARFLRTVDYRDWPRGGGASASPVTNGTDARRYVR